MTSVQVESSFKELACKNIELAPDGRDKFIVHTPFRFDDGDHFVIMLKASEHGWMLTDEGHTMMHLSYGGFKVTPTRQLLIDQTLKAADAAERDGEITLDVIDDQFGSALFAFAQLLIRVAEVAKWTREHVRTTFQDDFEDLLSSVIPADRLRFNYSDPVHDAEGKYRVDCKVDGMPRPLYIFAISGDLKCKDATIAIHQLRNWNDKFESMAIFQDQSHISRRTLARFSDVVGKQFSSVGVKSEIVEYLATHIPGLGEV